jgi:hypothetical protein
MSVLSNLKLTSTKKPAQLAPVQQRRHKLMRRLQEQIDLAKAEQAGELFRPKRFKSVKDAEGNTVIVEVGKRVKAWWFTSEGGRLCLSVRYGAKLLELSKGKPTIDIGVASDLVPTLELLRTAVEAGELDAQMESASGLLRSGFKR